MIDMIGFRAPAAPALVTILKCTKTQDITVRIGNVVRTMSIGEWSQLIANPIKVDPPAESSVARAIS
jgi:hypothetical protein